VIRIGVRLSIDVVEAPPVAAPDAGGRCVPAGAVAGGFAGCAVDEAVVEGPGEAEAVAEGRGVAEGVGEGLAEVVGEGLVEAEAVGEGLAEANAVAVGVVLGKAAALVVCR